MAAFAARRSTRDIDLAAIKIRNDSSDVEDRIRAIVTVARDDGLVDPTSVVGELIPDAADYAGVRVHVSAQLATARVALHVDRSRTEGSIFFGMTPSFRTRKEAAANPYRFTADL